MATLTQLQATYKSYYDANLKQFVNDFVEEITDELNELIKVGRFSVKKKLEYPNKPETFGIIKNKIIFKLEDRGLDVSEGGMAFDHTKGFETTITIKADF